MKVTLRYWYLWVCAVAGSILVILPCVLVNLMDLDFSYRMDVTGAYVFGSPVVLVILIFALFRTNKPLNRNKKLFRLSLLSFFMWCYLLLIIFTNSEEGSGIFLALILMVSTPIVLVFLGVGIFFYTRK